MAQQIAELTGETPAEAIRTALAERLRREQLKRRQRPWDESAIRRIIARCASLPLRDARTDEEILGYDENGLPG